MTPEDASRVANERLMQMMPQVLPAPDAMGPNLHLVPAPATGLTQPLPDAPTYASPGWSSSGQLS